MHVVILVILGLAVLVSLGVVFLLGSISILSLLNFETVLSVAAIVITHFGYQLKTHVTATGDIRYLREQRERISKRILEVLKKEERTEWVSIARLAAGFNIEERETLSQLPRRYQERYNSEIGKEYYRLDLMRAVLKLSAQDYAMVPKDKQNKDKMISWNLLDEAWVDNFGIKIDVG